MATANTTGKTRSTRNRPAGRRPKVKAAAASAEALKKAERRTAPPPADDADEEQEGDLQELIEEERSRLQGAEAVLACLHFTLTYADYFEPNEAPSYPDVAEIAMGMIRTAVDHLDSLYINPKIRAAVNVAARKSDD